MNSPFFEHANDPVDPQLFAFAVDLFQAAASGRDLHRANASEASGQ